MIFYTKEVFMPRETIQSTKNNIQRAVCQDVHATGDVIKSQVFSALMEMFSGNLERSDLEKLKTRVDTTIDGQTSSLIDRIIKTTT